MPTSVHRPFRVVAINDGAKYGFESWRYGWELADSDGRLLARYYRHDKLSSVAAARAAILDVLDAFGLGDAALRLDPRSVAEALGAPSDAEPPGPRPRPFKITRYNHGRDMRGWYWSLLGAGGYELGRSLDYPTREDCEDSIALAIAAIYGMLRPVNDLVDG